MTLEEMATNFEREDDEFLKFRRIESPRNGRPDLHAFLLLDELLPGNTDIVAAAEHDEIYLEVNVEKLSAVITEEHIVELRRCGVRYCGEYDCLCMFV